MFSLTVTSDYDKTVDFTQFKTYSYYGWADNSDKILTPFDKERIEKAFADEFNNRGINFQKEGGDLVVASVYCYTSKNSKLLQQQPALDGMYGGMAVIMDMGLAGAGEVG